MLNACAHLTQHERTNMNILTFDNDNYAIFIKRLNIMQNDVDAFDNAYNKQRFDTLFNAIKQTATHNDSKHMILIDDYNDVCNIHDLLCANVQYNIVINIVNNVAEYKAHLQIMHDVLRENGLKTNRKYYDTFASKIRKTYRVKLCFYNVGDANKCMFALSHYDAKRVVGKHADKRDIVIMFRMPLTTI